MEDVPELFPSFLVLFSFLFLSSPEKRYPSLCSKPMLHPYSSFCLQPFSNYSMAAVDFDYCPAGAVKPVGASSISSYSEPTAEPFFAPHPPPHTDNPQQCWGSHTWHGGAMAAMQGTVGVSSNIQAGGCSPPGSQGHSSSLGVAGAGRSAFIWWLTGLWSFVLLEGKLKVDQIPLKFFSFP